MGILFSSLLALFNRTRQYKVVIVGLDNAGKSTILYKLWVKEVVCTGASLAPAAQCFADAGARVSQCQRWAPTTRRSRTRT